MMFGVYLTVVTVGNFDIFDCCLFIDILLMIWDLPYAAEIS